MSDYRWTGLVADLDMNFGILTVHERYGDTVWETTLSGVLDNGYELIDLLLDEGWLPAGEATEWVDHVSDTRYLSVDVAGRDDCGEIELCQGVSMDTVAGVIRNWHESGQRFAKRRMSA